MQEDNISIIEKSEIQDNEQGRLILLIPALISLLLIIGTLNLKSGNVYAETSNFTVSIDVSQMDTALLPKLDQSALIAPELYSSSIRDTIYTDKDLWLELRVDEQKLHIHYRDGSEKTYLVSTGNKFTSKGVETRPGIFAIFSKEEVHESSQFNNAKMFHYMPFNMGIGFHGLAGTGYYGFLGIRPSSHGCIRMRNDDVKSLFKESEIGTLVLTHYGNSARIVAFAPEGFINEREYTSNDYMKMLAYNINLIYEGKYLHHKPRRFILDGKQIPRIGFNVGNTEDIPEKQLIPTYFGKFVNRTDVLKTTKLLIFNTVLNEIEPEFAESFEIKDRVLVEEGDVEVSDEIVKKLGYNKLGILPYFPPNR